MLSGRGHAGRGAAGSGGSHAGAGDARAGGAAAGGEGAGGTYAVAVAVAVAGGPERVPALLGVLIRSVATSAQFSLALCTSGSVYSWGYGGEGQLGHGDETNRDTPTLIDELCHERIAAIAVGDDHSLAATDGGALYSWGYLQVTAYYLHTPYCSLVTAHSPLLSTCRRAL